MELQAVSLRAIAERLVGKAAAAPRQQLGAGGKLEALLMPVIDMQRIGKKVAALLGMTGK
jgi:hypothetical protein